MTTSEPFVAVPAAGHAASATPARASSGATATAVRRTLRIQRNSSDSRRRSSPGTFAAYYDCNAAAFKVQVGARPTVTRTTHTGAKGTSGVVLS
jgi:hypothetical protein